ncbi:hypothetical protein GCM10023187_51680 [Nibrella viscosa]|uniref:Uncharacterized protein n=1 Tax=Nibrella viscosa TaxID=1084524 RepID=A0ABP8KWX7_9BACT
MERVQLIIEAPTTQDQSAGFWGRVTYEDNLIVDHAENLKALQANMRQLLLDFHDLGEVEFELCYDLHSFFEHYEYLKISKIAAYAGMNPSLLRHYKAQTKFPSMEQVRRIETAVHQLASELQQVHLVAR